MEKILRFLEIQDIKELGSFYSSMNSPTEDDIFIIDNVLDKWDDAQAIANLLLFPKLIPQKRLWQIFEKALDSYDQSYIILTAIFSLKDISVESIPDKYKKLYIAKLQRFCKTNTNLLATGALHTLVYLLDDTSYRDLVYLYPLDNPKMNEYIINATVLLLQKSTLAEYKTKLKKAGITWWQKKPFVKKFTLFKQGSLSQESLVIAFTAIPNLQDISN